MNRRRGSRLKRVIDVVGSAAGLVALSPVLGVSALAVIMDIGRPIFFKHQRPGLDGQVFTLYKLRTMRPPRAGEVYFRTDEERLTPIGRWLRASSLDELPELWNVLKGEMSLVGPRPLLVEYLPRYTEAQRRRHEVCPGITGWAQVNGRQTNAFSKRLEYDVWYVDNWSLMLDFKILALTFLSVVRRQGVISGQNVDDVDDLGLARNV